MGVKFSKSPTVVQIRKSMSLLKATTQQQGDRDENRAVVSALNMNRKAFAASRK